MDNMDVSINGGTPIAGCFTRKNHNNILWELGVPLFSETPNVFPFDGDGSRRTYAVYFGDEHS